MPPARRPASKRAPEPEPFASTGLAEIGIAEGDRVRFRRRDGERWKEAVVSRREADGSVSVRDARGSLRALPLDAIEIRFLGPRGGIVWEPLTERAARTEQMRLL